MTEEDKIKIECKYCKTPFDASFYFYNHSINLKYFSTHESPIYTAEITGRVICPGCGTEIKIRFSKELEKKDIIELATKGVGSTI